MKKLLLLIVLFFSVSSPASAGWLESVKGAAQSVTQGATQGVTQGAGNVVPGGSCDVVAGRSGQKIEKAMVQPDPMNGRKIVAKEKILTLMKDEGFTCEPSKTGFDKVMYDSAYACSKPYSGGGRYKWIEASFQCKAGDCGEPTPRCGEKRETF
jgi:hypothetical protein